MWSKNFTRVLFIRVSTLKFGLGSWSCVDNANGYECVRRQHSLVTASYPSTWNENITVTSRYRRTLTCAFYGLSGWSWLGREMGMRRGRTGLTLTYWAGSRADRACSRPQRLRRGGKQGMVPSVLVLHLVSAEMVQLCRVWPSGLHFHLQSFVKCSLHL